MNPFLAAFGGMFLYFFFWAGVMTVGGIVFRTADELTGGILMGIAAAGFVILLLPFMQWISGAVFRFPGEGDPVSEAALRERITAVNLEDTPIVVEERGDKLVVTLNVADAKWWGVLSRSGLNQVYELHIKLDEEKHVATLIDVKKSVEWRAGPGEVRLRGGYSRGVDLSYERRIDYGWNDAYEFGRTVDLTFKTSDIKDPVVNLITASGWTVKFGLW